MYLPADSVHYFDFSKSHQCSLLTDTTSANTLYAVGHRSVQLKTKTARILMQDFAQVQNLASRFSQFWSLTEPNGVQPHRVC